MSQTLKDAIDWLFQPTLYFSGSALAIVLVFLFRKHFVKPIVMIGITALSVVFFVWAFDDPNFNKIITKPDNVPIVILLFSVVFFSWLALRQAVANDERAKEGKPSIEAELSKRKVFTWPDLVYTEFICLVLLTAFLIVWSIEIEAPIEEPAALSRTPNPSKAPWYFLGLQELLVYFDPWIAGVVLPGFIIVGLCAIPYLDPNPKGNGYYTYEQRPFAWKFFWMGFILFWVSFVILGTFLRGPNWSFFGPFEYWDIHKLEPLVNVDLSTYVWVDFLGKPRPTNPLVREAPGFLFLGAWFVVLPALMSRTFFKKLALQMGTTRFVIFSQLLLWFVLIPVKMLLRWTVNLKYIVGIPEWFFNV